MEHLFKLHRGNEAKVSMRIHYVENEMKIHNCGVYVFTFHYNSGTHGVLP